MSWKTLYSGHFPSYRAFSAAYSSSVIYPRLRCCFQYAISSSYCAFRSEKYRYAGFRSAHSFLSSSRFAAKFSASSALGALPIRSEPQEQHIFGVTP